MLALIALGYATSVGIDKLDAVSVLRLKLELDMGVPSAWTFYHEE